MTSPEEYTQFNGKDLPSATNRSDGDPSAGDEQQTVDFALYVHQLKKQRDMRDWFILSLEGSGLASALEAEGIIPSEPDNPNPIDPDSNEKQHELWWKEHSQEGDTFIRKNEERRHDLEMIAWGAMLERLINKLSPHR